MPTLDFVSCISEQFCAELHAGVMKTSLRIVLDEIIGNIIAEFLNNKKTQRVARKESANQVDQTYLLRPSNLLDQRTTVSTVRLMIAVIGILFFFNIIFFLIFYLILKQHAPWVEKSCASDDCEPAYTSAPPDRNILEDTTPISLVCEPVEFSNIIEESTPITKAHTCSKEPINHEAIVENLLATYVAACRKIYSSCFQLLWNAVFHDPVSDCVTAWRNLRRWPISNADNLCLIKSSPEGFDVVKVGLPTENVSTL